MLSRTASRTASSPARTSSAGRRGSAACADQRTDAGRSKWRKASGSRKAMSSAIRAPVEREHDDVVGGEVPVLVAPQVEGEGRLAARAGGITRQRIPGAQRRAAQEARDRVAAAVPGRHRRHGDGRLLGEHRDDRVDVAALPGRDERVDDLAQALVPERAQRGLLAALGQPLVDALVRTLQRAVDRRGRRLERLGRPRAPEKPSTSRRISTARWRAGRCCSAAMNASSMLSRCS